MSFGNILFRTGLAVATCIVAFGASVAVTNYVAGPAEKEPAKVFYTNCAQMLSAGAAPIAMGQPGYRAALDSDQDGMACEAD